MVHIAKYINQGFSFKRNLNYLFLLNEIIPSIRALFLFFFITHYISAIDDSYKIKVLKKRLALHGHEDRTKADLLNT